MSRLTAKVRRLIFYYSFVVSIEQHPPLHPLQPPEQEHEFLPFLRFLTDVKIVAKNITAITAATEKVAKSTLFTPLIILS